MEVRWGVRSLQNATEGEDFEKKNEILLLPYN